jgi:predicted ATPase/class 3 adenylate cyclase
MSEIPTGTVTFLFTDIAGSTKLWQQHPDAMPNALVRHHALLNEAIAANGGYVFQIIGDAFCAAFATASAGLDAALAAQRALRDAPWGETGAIRVRMALHTGAGEVRVGEHTSGEYVSGLTLSRAARLLSAGHGGQILLSLATAELVRDQLPPDVSLRDLDAHRLKDLIRPEHIYQVVAPDLRSDFLPLKSLDAHPNNLPIQLTSFIGREQEMARVLQILNGTRLVSLTGAGGAGKTRLALQVAADLIDEFPDGVWFVELAPLTDPTLIPQTIAALLGLREETGRPVMTMLSDYLRAKTTLLLLDNCEHLIDACAKFADTILRAAPKVKILATSREAFGIGGETAYRVPSLSLPPKDASLGDVASLSQYEAVRLFIDRAMAVQPDFSVTNGNAPALAQICHRLDGIPLALELAAARVKSLSVEQIAARLDDRFRLLTGGSRTALPRQQTLRAAIDWSYDLLAEEERVLLRRLSVFAGGWTLEAAPAVCSCDPVCADDVLDLLARLVDKSLVVFEQRNSETRYRMMETIRQYARDRLLESHEAETIRNRHLDFFMAFAEQVEPKLRGPEQMQWLDRLDLEHDNLRAALEWSLGEGRVEKGLRLGAALAWFWERCGYWREGRERVESLLNQPEPTAKTLIRANGLFAASVLTSSLGAAWVGGSNASRPYLEEVIAIAREHGQAGKRLCALALTFLSNNLHTDNPALALSHYDDAWLIAQELGDQWISALLLHQRGHWFEGQKDDKATRNAFEDSMMLFRSVGDRRWEAILFSDIAELSFIQGDTVDARRRLEQNLPFFRETKDRQHICFTVIRLGEIARAEGNYELAKKYSSEGLEIARELGGKMQIASASVNLGFVAVYDGELNSARSLFVESLARARELDSKPGVAFALLGFASAAATEKQARRAVHLLAVVDTLLEGGDKGSLDPADEAEYKRNLALARAQLDEAVFNAAWAEGQKMTVEQAVELALKEVGSE